MPHTETGYFKAASSSKGRKRLCAHGWVDYPLVRISKEDALPLEQGRGMSKPKLQRFVSTQKMGRQRQYSFCCSSSRTDRWTGPFTHIFFSGINAKVGYSPSFVFEKMLHFLIPRAANSTSLKTQMMYHSFSVKIACNYRWRLTTSGHLHPIISLLEVWHRK